MIFGKDTITNKVRANKLLDFFSSNLHNNEKT